MQEVDKQYPGQFGYILNKDGPKTGNMEIQIFRSDNPTYKRFIH